MRINDNSKGVCYKMDLPNLVTDLNWAPMFE